MKKAAAVAILGFVVVAPAAAQEPQAVSFRTRDGWVINADSYGTSDRALLLIHGGRFTKESWRPQIPDFLKAGFRVLAIDLRGFGMSQAGPAAQNTGFASSLDALAAVRYLRATGAKSVSIVGGSMGADAAAGASIEAEPGEIDRLVLLAGSAEEPADKLKGRKLFIVARGDANAAGPRLPRIQKQFDGALPPKEFLLLDGSAHAQFLFQSDQGGRLMNELLRFLSAAPIADAAQREAALAAGTQPLAPQAAPGKRNWAARHPVVVGTLVGTGIGMAWIAGQGCDSSDYTCGGLLAFGGGVGAMFGSLGGLVVGIALR